MKREFVSVDLSFVTHTAHREVLRSELGLAVREGALGVLVCGSVARGTACPNADLDLRVYAARSQPFESLFRDGVLVERHHHTFEQAQARLASRPPDLYAWQEARILHDPTLALHELKARAHEALAAYRTPEADRRAVRHWLTSTVRKLHSDLDTARQVFFVHTTTWKLLEGVCVLYDRPVPSSTLMWELLPVLPGPGSGWWRPLLLGEPGERVAAFENVTAWLLENTVDL
ncbi:nucleotidyltransferase domain-containing protein [Deinococcus peraridilitoris]|uniref:Nucleotidyltransferase family protein n=1 Tax=Deinococcus peraridilitoris (strain DSM 19664 / LMG 22246 / CIP 109416 / KR-200) TaxID=937777 RepID=L0A4W6_DEIPD|nr:nucleotidyltransferase domain-containing protein [Deinococcus peraridilitoris]AFZ68055.1 nucleotidyltransferase family protein [Deinococcus peraridilitoris DSM 19664]